MQLRQSSAPLLVSAAVVVIVSLLVLLRPAVQYGGHSLGSNAEPRSVAVPSAPAAGVSALLLADDLRDAVQRFRAADDPVLSYREIRALVDQSCRVPQLLQMDGRDSPDWRRDRFVNELNRRCSGWAVPSMFVADTNWDVLIDEPPPRLSAQAALVELRQARDARSLRRSWWDAYRLNALPQAQIFADQRRLLPAEALQLIDVVIDWRQCARFNACGPDSLLTLRVCALHGCQGDEDLLGAWHAALSPRDFESAQAIAHWLPQWTADD